MTDFTLFSQAVHARFNELAANHELFLSHLHGELLWEAYLAAFPEGSNPIFRERTEHDCSCCRHFVRNIGGVVAVINGQVQSVWGDWQELPEPYRTVAAALDELITKHPLPIHSLYRTTPKLVQFGTDTTYEAVAGGSPLVWNHFHARVPAKFLSETPDATIGEFNTSVQMLKRALGLARDSGTGHNLPGISPDAVATVLALIDDNNLYRGEQYREVVAQFQQLARAREGLATVQEREVFLWTSAYRPAARIRNTAIGTLLVDLSESVPLERAVKSFEDKVSGTNYKRPKKLVTQAMIDKALATVEDLNLETAMNRRHAKISDITVNNVVWADRSAAQRMKGGLAGLLADVPVTQHKGDLQATDISFSDFLAEVVPNALSMELMLRNTQQGNLMSLTAPVSADVQPLFPWDNNFAWSYNGNITDSIKEKVKRAGGNTGAALRVSLAWFNGDDLDIHAKSPDGYVYFGQPGGSNTQRFSIGRILDVDMNAGMVKNSVDPVENLSWTNPKDGPYEILVNQFACRNTDKVGFVIEVENNGVVTQYSYSKRVVGTVSCLQMVIKGGKIIELTASKDLVGGGLANEVWGVKTEVFVPVETVLYSPNHWDGNASGLRHHFFILKGCKNPEPCRGIYNEFLRSELAPHGKVLEILGSKTMCPVADEQLSGAGFTSGRGDQVTVRVDGLKARRVFNVQF